MLLARQIDQVEQEITSRGEAHFHLSGAGHEATVALNDHLITDDWLHCHYRSRALLLARGLPVETFLNNLLGNAESLSQGRRMSAFFAEPKLNLLSMVTPVGNNALQSVGVASAVKDQTGNPIVVCGVGDGTTQQGEFLEACSEAQRQKLPVLFLVENNSWAISTPTDGNTFFHQSGDAFFGIPIRHLDGSDIVSCNDQFSEIVSNLRTTRNPAIAIIHVPRLASHTNADDHSIYRSDDNLEKARQLDPITRCHQELVQRGVPENELTILKRSVIAEVKAAEAHAFSVAAPEVSFTAKKPLPIELTHASRESRGDGEPVLTMRDSIRKVLRNHLVENSEVCLFGEDIEDPKGDVFGVTRGLSTEFPQRVQNAPLSESTITN